MRLNDTNEFPRPLVGLSDGRLLVRRPVGASSGHFIHRFIHWWIFLGAVERTWDHSKILFLLGKDKWDRSGRIGCIDRGILGKEVLYH